MVGCAIFPIYEYRTIFIYNQYTYLIGNGSTCIRIRSKGIRLRQGVNTSIGGSDICDRRIRERSSILDTHSGTVVGDDTQIGSSYIGEGDGSSELGPR